MPPGRGRGGLCPYRIFLLEPNLVAELIPDFPPDCRFDYFAPVLKERERCLDGLFHILASWCILVLWLCHDTDVGRLCRLI
ncbi:MAG: DUF2887 domain-containing protein [Phormidium sp. SL48-SHIP]|nr:MAG: DUF2887 domain-containing protein [Phormidium sp. SL48-SHIP]